MLLTLVGLILLAGLIFYVYNAGDQVNRRLEMQGAADSVAVTGAGWMARNMNVVAMNNVGEAKMISLVPILDTQPLASAMALAEVTAWEEMLRGIGDQPQIDPEISPGTEAYLKDGIESLRMRMETQRDILRPYALAINQPNFDMESITHWAVPGTEGSPPHGMLWRAATTMEEFSRAAVDSCGALAQQRASRMGRQNTADAAFLSPILPVMPARFGEYMDFQPTIRGKLHVESETAYMTPTGGRGGAIPDFAYPHRLGPWARLLRWRDYISQFVATGQSWVSGRPASYRDPGPPIGQTRGSHGNVSVGGRRVGKSARQANRSGGSSSGGWVPGTEGHWRTTGHHERVGYTTYGPYEWAMRRTHNWARGTQSSPGKLRDTFYHEYLNTICRIKLDYMFPPDGIGETTGTKEIHYPVWITGYPQCKEIGDDPDNDVKTTLIYLVEIASKYPEGSAGFMTPGTFRTNGEYPIAIWAGGWEDPAKWEKDGRVKQVSNYVWRDSYDYETTLDRELGIALEMIPPGDLDGQVVWHPVYMYAWYMFGGIDIGGNVEVSNPANWDGFDQPPAPCMLDTAEGDYGGDDPDVGWRRDRFMYLGVARKQTPAKAWPQRFSHVNPLKGTMTVAQAKVFNSKSFGLWTQDWRVQLAPVTRVGPLTDPESWVARLEQDLSGAEVPDSVEPQEVETALQYLSSLDPDIVDVYMTH